MSLVVNSDGVSSPVYGKDHHTHPRDNGKDSLNEAHPTLENLIPLDGAERDDINICKTGGPYHGPARNADEHGREANISGSACGSGRESNACEDTVFNLARIVPYCLKRDLLGTVHSGNGPRVDTHSVLDDGVNGP